MPGFADIVENIQDAATTIVDGGGGGGSGDSGIAIAGESLETGGSGSIGWLSSIRKAITSRLPASLGQKSTASSFSAALSTEQEALLSGINGKLPGTLGQKASSASLSAALSTEQEDLISEITAQVTLSAASGADQEIILAAIRDRLPSSLGQKASAASISSVLSTEQEVILTAVRDRLPSSVGQKSTANSLSVGLSTEQETILTAIRDRLMPVGTITPYLGTSAGANLKASAGNVYAITCTNLNSATRYFQLFAKASAPTGGDTPVHSFPVYGNGGLLVIGQDVVGGGGIALSTGVAWGISTTALTYTAATANETIATVRWA